MLFFRLGKGFEHDSMNGRSKKDRGLKINKKNTSRTKF